MRFERLDLIRYGMFTDHQISLPNADRDFHVIVGPNEAGKSTVRSAILDLLYSISKNTPYAFLHVMSDMRLGAKIEHNGNVLDFLRIKGNKQTLRDPSGAPLPDGALGPYLGTTDKEFFSQMFGLDHARLVTGGHSILSASNDLGQILFQSAAGIGSLGVVREALKNEAEKLWSKRRSGERLYYIASDELDRATASLKAATVRTKDWVEAQSKVTELEGVHNETKKKHFAIKARRNLLERIRRIAPHLTKLDDTNAQLSSLGPVAELPETAAKTLADAERVIATAQVDIDHQSSLVLEAQSSLDILIVDHRIREVGAEITELNAQRLQYRAYGADIGRRQSEIDTQWRIVVELAASLGWDTASEAVVRASIPSIAVRAALNRLIRTHAALQQAFVATERAEKAKRSEIESTQEELERLASADVPVGLLSALTQAKKLGDVEVAIRDRQQAVQKREVALETACVALGKWRLDIEALRAMSVPSSDVIKELVREQVTDDAEARTLAARVQSLEHQVEQATLEVAQYQRAHEPVTRDAMLSARQARQKTWFNIKTNADELSKHADEYEQLVLDADALADRRHDTAQETSELLSKQAYVERLEQELQAVRRDAVRLEDGAVARAEKWRTLLSECGMPSIPLQSAGSWLESRRIVLEAWEALLEARLSLLTAEDARASARLHLTSELVDAGIKVNDEHLGKLVIWAEDYVSVAAGVRGQRHTLQKQHSDAERDVGILVEEAAAARKAMDEWQNRWIETLQRAKLEPQTDIGTVEGALEVIEKIDGALVAMRNIKVDRIDKMRADLDAHAKVARALAERIAPDLIDKTAFDISLELESRLTTANETHHAVERQRSIQQAAQVKLDDATLRRNQAQATLVPLLERSESTSSAEIAEAIAKSDRRRKLLGDQAAAEKAIRDGGDGMSLEQLRTEAATVEPSAIIGELGDLTAEDEDLVNLLTDLSAQKHASSVALLAIGGAADAAKAEAQRQEALAKMADAVERYVKVYTAAQLLKWSIEQYREAKQGPMLSLASRIFSQLTLGSFDKLTVDFDSEPLKLLGRRPNGTVVEIDGMSDGTRDQLYLALRLSALDMHLSQAHVLPFIADDLFINYDDMRSKAGLEALGELSRKTQVLFLTHHEHLLTTVQEVFGTRVNVIKL